MVKKFKLSRKQNVSELMNPKKTKKYSILHNTYNTVENYKQNIQNLIEKKNKRKNKKKYIEKKYIETQRIQKGGVETKKTTLFKKANPLPAGHHGIGKSLFSINMKAADREKGMKMEASNFEVFTKSQYFWLKRNIYNTIRGSWLLQKLHRISIAEHELLKRLLKSHMFFARLKLIGKKLRAIIIKLYGDNDSLLVKLQTKISKIFELQMDIENAYKNPNEADTKKESRFFGKKDKSYDQIVKDIIKEQDIIREEIMKLTIFYNTKDLSSKCKTSNFTKKLFTFAGDGGMTKGFRKSKEIICMIGKYRKYESKFNKFYYLYREQYKLFVIAFPNCDSTIADRVFDSFLNIDEETEYNELKKKNAGISGSGSDTLSLYAFDKTKCDKNDLHNKVVGLLTAINEVNKKENKNNFLEKNEASKKAFTNKASDFGKLQSEFKNFVDKYKQLFGVGEAYGIRHHHGLPRKKSLLDKLSGKNKSEVLAKKARLEELSTDPVFITHFTDMIKGFANDAKTIFQPESNEKTLRDTIIPYIELYESYYYNNALNNNEYNKLEREYNEAIKKINENTNQIKEEIQKIATEKGFDNDRLDILNNNYKKSINDFEIIINNIINKNDPNNSVADTLATQNAKTVVTDAFNILIGNAKTTANDFTVAKAANNVNDIQTTSDNADDIAENCNDLKKTFLVTIKNLNLLDKLKNSLDVINMPRQYNVKTNFRIFSINLYNLYDELREELKKNKENINFDKYFYNIFNEEHELPVVVCVQNGIKNDPILEKYILKNLYVCVSYSYSYNGTPIDNIKKYNIIYIRKKCINNEINNINNIIPIDQTDYFSLQNIPKGEGITLEKFSKSFAAVNLHFAIGRANTNVYNYVDYANLPYDYSESDKNNSDKLHETASQVKERELQIQRQRQATQTRLRPQTKPQSIHQSQPTAQSQSTPQTQSQSQLQTNANIALKHMKQLLGQKGGGALIPKTAKPGFTIVNTELVGSRVEDLLHIKEINEFKLREKQLDEIFAKIIKYTNQAPKIICGDFGGTKSRIIGKTLTDLRELYKKTTKDTETDTTIDRIVTIFYINGMTNLKYNNFSPKYDPNNMDKTKTEIPIISNYIFSTVNLNYYNISDNSKIDDFGGILPISVVLDATNINNGNLVQTDYTQLKGKDYGNTKLYSKTELTNIIKMIDKLMSHFTYGYKAYLKRDLGCFSFDEKNDSSNKLNYSIRLKKSFDEKIAFYTMNYPAFIDVHLYQLGGEYNLTSGEYYSENQISRSETSFIPENKLNFLKTEILLKQPQILKNALIRMLLIPSSDLKEISSITTNKSSGIDYEVTSAKSYMKLLQDFSLNFYRDKVIPNLEERLSKILDQNKFLNSAETAQYKPEAVAKVQSDIINRGLLYQLLQIEKVQSSEKSKLKNISNPDLIKKLFEFILIMLKLKYVEVEVNEITKVRLEIEAPVVENEKYAVFGENYKQKVKLLYTKLNEYIASSFEIKAILKFEIKKELIEIKILKGDSTVNFNPIAPDLTNQSEEINPEGKVIAPAVTTIKTYLELKHLEAFIAYSSLLQIAKCLNLIKNIADIVDNKNKIESFKSQINVIVGTSITSDAKTGDTMTTETIKHNLEILIENYENINKICNTELVTKINADETTEKNEKDIIAKYITDSKELVRDANEKLTQISIDKAKADNALTGNPQNKITENRKTEIDKLFVLATDFVNKAEKALNDANELNDTLKKVRHNPINASIEDENGFKKVAISAKIALDNAIQAEKERLENEALEVQIEAAIQKQQDIFDNYTFQQKKKNIALHFKNLSLWRDKLKKKPKPTIIFFGNGPTVGGAIIPSITNQKLKYNIGSIQNTLLESKNQNPVSDIYILNYADINKIAGGFDETNENEESELFKTSFEFYESMKTIKINDTDKLENDNNTYKLTSENNGVITTKSNDTLLDYILISRDLTFDRYDKTAQITPDERYLKLPNGGEYKASVISVFWPDLKDPKQCANTPTPAAAAATPVATATQPDIPFKITDKIKIILTTEPAAPAPAPAPVAPPKILIIGVGCFDKNHVDKTNQINYNNFVEFIYKTFILKIDESILTSSLKYDEIIFCFPDDTILNETGKAFRSIFNLPIIPAAAPAAPIPAAAPAAPIPVAPVLPKDILILFVNDYKDNFPELIRLINDKPSITGKVIDEFIKYLIFTKPNFFSNRDNRKLRDILVHLSNQKYIKEHNVFIPVSKFFDITDPIVVGGERVDFVHSGGAAPAPDATATVITATQPNLSVEFNPNLITAINKYVNNVQNEIYIIIPSLSNTIGDDIMSGDNYFTGILMLFIPELYESLKKFGHQNGNNFDYIDFDQTKLIYTKNLNFLRYEINNYSMPLLNPRLTLNNINVFTVKQDDNLKYLEKIFEIINSSSLDKNKILFIDPIVLMKSIKVNNEYINKYLEIFINPNNINQNIKIIFFKYYGDDNDYRDFQLNFIESNVSEDDDKIKDIQGDWFPTAGGYIKNYKYISPNNKKLNKINKKKTSKKKKSNVKKNTKNNQNMSKRIKLSKRK